jgi:ferredoxin-thioredoxin reductase catalytic subunit
VAISKETEQKFDVERFNLRKLSELEIRKEYQIKRRSACRVLTGKHEGKRLLGCPKHIWEDNIKMDLQEGG